MQKIFDHQSDGSTSKAPLEVEFTLPDAGWIRLRIRPLHDLYAVRCTYIWDPFEPMIAWLEEIAKGSDATSWSINEEGALSHLQFYGGNACADDHADHLLHVQSDHLGIARVRGVQVDRRQLVESIYHAFRLMADDPAYSASKWEAHPQYDRFDDMADAEYDRAIRAYPYEGCNLRELTSTALETYLTSESDGKLAPRLL